MQQSRRRQSKTTTRQRTTGYALDTLVPEEDRY